MEGWPLEHGTSQRPSQNLAEGGSQAVLAARAARLHWNLKASRSRLVLREAHSGEETPTGRHPPSAFWQPFRFGPRPISSVLTAWQSSCLHPKGSCYLSPGQGCRQDPDNPGKNEQMAFLSQAFEVAAASSLDCCLRLTQPGCPPGSI